ncbi:MAG: sulfotransferase [Gammaproteobacteria bacterium]|nr:sulfotransferase [Gammaproteobacteria bacterium]
MSLEVIGSGFGRTGTMTTKQALEILGYGPCHHMVEIIENPHQLVHWKALAAGATVDWSAAYAGYSSQVDWPGASVWEQTAAAFPGAKVIHTERPEDAWWNSFNGTIGKFFAVFRDLELPPHIMDQFDTMEKLIIHGTFGDFRDRDSALAAYRANNRRVREVIPPERLLVFHVADGWDPLCEFLGVPVPAEPFPHSNPKKEFWEHFGGEPE